MVEIEGVDINACGGTHTASLAELQVSSTLVGDHRTSLRKLTVAPTLQRLCHASGPLAWTAVTVSSYAVLNNLTRVLPDFGVI